MYFITPLMWSSLMNRGVKKGMKTALNYKGLKLCKSATKTKEKSRWCGNLR